MGTPPPETALRRSVSGMRAGVRCASSARRRAGSWGTEVDRRVDVEGLVAEGIDDGVEGNGAEAAGEMGREFDVVVVLLVLGIVDDLVGPEALDHSGVSAAADADD